MYCQECDREDVGSFHKCFVRLRNQVRPLQKKPAPKKPPKSLAMKLAEIYRETFGEEFPGGIENAKIERVRAGAGDRSAGAWSWELVSISREHSQKVISFGSIYTAKETVRAGRLLDDGLRKGLTAYRGAA